jgi:hypothetical protein
MFKLTPWAAAAKHRDAEYPKVRACVCVREI